MERVSEELTAQSDSGYASLEIEKRDVAHAALSKFKWKLPKITKENSKVALSLIGALAAIYVFVSLLFAGLLVASIEVRQEDWIELPSRFFGDFSKVERPLVDLNGVQLTRTLVDAGPDISAVTVQPVGMDRQDCDPENEDEGTWVLFPWVTDNLDRLQPVMECPSERQTFTSILPNGNVGDGNGGLGENVCTNFVPKDQTQDL